MNRSILSVLLLAIAVALVSAKTITPGSQDEIDVDSPMLVTSLEAAERKMDNLLNSPYVHRVKTVKKAYRQVVSGLRFLANIEFAETTCLKSETKDVEHCTEVTKTMDCTVELWVQPWVNRNDIINFQCN